VVENSKVKSLSSKSSSKGVTGKKRKCKELSDDEFDDDDEYLE